MLSDGERADIEGEVAKSFTRRAACIRALKIVQAHRGYVSDEAIRDLAPVLGMSPDDLDGVATFYNLIFRNPVGRKVLKVCDSVVCWELGGDSLMGYLSQRLGIKPGETTPDGEFTLLPICCLGDCDHAPVMMVNDVHLRNVTRELLDRILSGEVPGED
jgi:NADH-quinone oxidoreductase subunit E